MKDEHTSRSSIVEYVSESAEYNKEQKRKSGKLSTEDDLEDYQNTKRFKYQKTKSGESSEEDDINECQQQAITSDYDEGMEFTKKFQTNRAEKGKTMSRELCLLEGRQKFN